MTDKKDAVLYSLSELEDMPQGEVAAPAETNSSGANIKRSRSKDKDWASDDDASDLLAGILDETSRSAEQEELERSRSLMALTRDKSDAAGSDKKREEGERRMAAEQTRREEADRKRRVLLREIEGPSPEEIEAERRAAQEARQQAEMEERLKEAERTRMEAERRAAHAARESREAEQQRLEALAAGPSPSTAKTAGIGLMAVALAFFVVVVLIGGGVGAWFAFKPQETPVQTYRRTALVPKSVTSTSIEKGFVALAPPGTANDAAIASDGKARPVKRGKRRTGKKGKKAKTGKKGKKFNFGASKGKIVF